MRVSRYPASVMLRTILANDALERMYLSSSPEAKSTLSCGLRAVQPSAEPLSRISDASVENPLTVKMNPPGLSLPAPPHTLAGW